MFRRSRGYPPHCCRLAPLPGLHQLTERPVAAHRVLLAHDEGQLGIGGDYLVDVDALPGELTHRAGNHPRSVNEILPEAKGQGDELLLDIDDGVPLEVLEDLLPVLLVRHDAHLEVAMDDVQGVSLLQVHGVIERLQEGCELRRPLQAISQSGLFMIISEENRKRVTSFFVRVSASLRTAIITAGSLTFLPRTSSMEGFRCSATAV